MLARERERRTLPRTLAEQLATLSSLQLERDRIANAAAAHADILEKLRHESEAFVRDTRAVEHEIAEILRPRWLSRVITWSLGGEEPASLRLSWRTDPAARRRLEAEVFGKRLLFTDREDWPVAEVVAAYRSQADVEAGFRQLKDPRVVSFSPMFHWTDQKIRVHVFYCVLALAVAHLLRRQAAQAGLHLSVRELLGTLAGIQETVLLYQGQRGRPRARHVLTEMDPIQQRLYDLFGLDAYAPQR